VIIGATTAFVAATIGLVQNDIKRVIAYSTMSQLGYMFVAAGVGVYSAAMFHLFTHAFFKALLFLGAGSVITAMHHEQDMRNYGGLRKKIPYTYWAMMIGTLAITGVGIPLTEFGFAGFLSKDAVIESAWGAQSGVGTYAFWTLVISALFTSFYSWRLMFMTFHGTPRGDRHAHDHAHDSPLSMLIPLGVLSLGAVFAGMIWFSSFFGTDEEVGEFFGLPVVAEAGETSSHDLTSAETSNHDLPVDETSNHDDEAVIETSSHDVPSSDEGAELAGWKPGDGALYPPVNEVMDTAHHAPVWVKISPFIAMLIGFAVAFLFYIARPSFPGRLAENQRPLYLFLLNKWYFDEIYEFIIVRPAHWIGGFLWRRGDGSVIDGGLNGLAMGIVPFFTRLAGRAQSGYLFHYAFAMVLGIVIFVTWMTLAGGSN
jgi:NADH-quinone oxidoreductase subunit L